LLQLPFAHPPVKRFAFQIIRMLHSKEIHEHVVDFINAADSSKKTKAFFPSQNFSQEFIRTFFLIHKGSLLGSETVITERRSRNPRMDSS
jgi:hypothetical protein